jgi:hypothetical protein
MRNEGVANYEALKSVIITNMNESGVENVSDLIFVTSNSHPVIISNQDGRWF